MICSTGNSFFAVVSGRCPLPPPRLSICLHMEVLVIALLGTVNSLL